MAFADSVLVGKDDDFVSIFMIFFDLFWDDLVPEDPVSGILSKLRSALCFDESIVLEAERHERRKVKNIPYPLRELTQKAWCHCLRISMFPSFSRSNSAGCSLQP